MGGINPFFNALVSQQHSTIANVFALQMCIKDTVFSSPLSRFYLWPKPAATSGKINIDNLIIPATEVRYTPLVAENFYSVQVSNRPWDFEVYNNLEHIIFTRLTGHFAFCLGNVNVGCWRAT